MEEALTAGGSKDPKGKVCAGRLGPRPSPPPEPRQVGAAPHTRWMGFLAAPDPGFPMRTAQVTEMVQMIAPHMAPAPNGGAAASGADGGASNSGGDSSRGGADAADPRVREYTIDELRAMKVRELKSLLHAYGVSEVEAVEKEELVEVIFALQSSAADKL